MTVRAEACLTAGRWMKEGVERASIGATRAPRDQNVGGLGVDGRMGPGTAYSGDSVASLLP